MERRELGKKAAADEEQRASGCRDTAEGTRRLAHVLGLIEAWEVSCTPALKRGVHPESARGGVERSPRAATTRRAPCSHSHSRIPGREAEVAGPSACGVRVQMKVRGYVLEFSGLRGATEEWPHHRGRDMACVALEASPAAGPRARTSPAIPLRPTEQPRGAEGETPAVERRGKVCSSSKFGLKQHPAARPPPAVDLTRALRPAGS